jgi:hypothetical protein
MAFRKTARALLTNKGFDIDQWMEELRRPYAGIEEKTESGRRIAKTLIRKCDPKQYLLSHATIVASVDTYEPKNIKLGRQLNQGVEIDVKFPDFKVKPECHEIINNNNDFWSRPLLLSSYRTFVGADNFCFVPGTKVLMADGTLCPIEKISVGDEVIGGSGLARKVVHKHERNYDGEVRLTYVGHSRNPIVSTPNHPYKVLNRDVCAVCSKPLSNNRPSSYKQRVNRVFCADCGRFRGEKSKFGIEPRWVRSDELKRRDVLCAPIPVRIPLTNGDPRFAKLVGYYLAEGCVGKNEKGLPVSIYFTVGTHEHELIQSILDVVRAISPDIRPNVGLSSTADSVTKISVYNAKLARAVYEVAGEYSYLKKLSRNYMDSLDREDVLSLLGAAISGDADVHCTTQRHRLCSTSLELLEQFQFLASCHNLNGFIVPASTKIGSSSQVKFRDGSIHSIICKHQAYVLHFDTRSTEILSKYTTLAKHQNRKTKAGDLKFLDGNRITYVNKVKTGTYSGLVYNLEVEEDHSYVINGTVCVSNCEHIQLKELSKGFIADAVARDLGHTVYVDILVATERRHQKLIQDILSGEMGSMSMGCLSLFTICNRCGNVAADDSVLCPCIMYLGKGNKFADEEGVEHPVAEQVGHISVPNSNTFIEASWVKNPAFKGAVRRNLLNPDEVSETQLSSVRSIHEVRSASPLPDGVAIAASLRRRAQDDPPAEEPAKEEPKAEESAAGDEDLTSEFDKAGEEPEEETKEETKDSESESEEKADKAPGFSEEKIDGLIDQIQESIVEAIANRIKEKLGPQPEDVGYAEVPSSGGLEIYNSNLGLGLGSQFNEFSKKLRRTFAKNSKLINWAEKHYKIVHDGGRRAIRANHVTSRDLVLLSWIEDRLKVGKNSSEISKLYKIAISTGPLTLYPSNRSFLTACSVKLGRKLSSKEEKFFLWKGKIASLSLMN